MMRRIFKFRRRARLAAALALLAAVAVVVILVLSTRSQPGTGSATSVATATGSTTVKRRDLVEMDTEAGTVSYADPQTVYNRLSGTITWLPRVGQVIKPGQTLYRVDGAPVLLMNGSTPAYRDLKASDIEGADIEQLNRNLVALGFNANAIVVDDLWQPATTTGVELLQASSAKTATGSLPLGQIVFLPDDQLVTTLDATVGSTGSGGGAPAAVAATDASIPPVAHADFVDLTGTTTTPDTATTSYAKLPSPGTRQRSTPPKKPKTSKAGSRHKTSSSPSSLTRVTALLKAEVTQLKAATAALRAAKSSARSSGRPSSSSSSSRSAASDCASGGGSATAILQTSSTGLIVTVDLSASSQSEAVLGERVTVELPAGNTVGGKITAVSPVAQTSSSTNGGATAGGGGSSVSGGASSTVPITITLNDHHREAGLDKAAVSVNFARAKAKHVLSVPVTALIATSGGNYAVQEAAAPHTVLPVTTGLFAAGYVQISGRGIQGGLQVIDSQG